MSTTYIATFCMQSESRKTHQSSGRYTGILQAMCFRSDPTEPQTQTVCVRHGDYLAPRTINLIDSRSCSAL